MPSLKSRVGPRKDLEGEPAITPPLASREEKTDSQNQSCFRKDKTSNQPIIDVFSAVLLRAKQH